MRASLHVPERTLRYHIAILRAQNLLIESFLFSDRRKKILAISKKKPKRTEFLPFEPAKDHILGIFKTARCCRMQDGYQNIGSIGTIGKPVYDRHNDRVKGFCTNVVESTDLVNDFIKKAGDIGHQNGATRLTARFLTKSPACLSAYGTMFETEYIPLHGKWNGYGIQYFVENSAKRAEPESVKFEEDRIVSESLRTARIHPLSKAAAGRGYIIETGLKTDRDITRLYQLYNAVYRDYVFPLTEKNVSELVENPNSITAIARIGSEIASVAIAEIVEIPTNAGILRISELSDEATHHNHRGNGLNQACVTAAIKELLTKYGDAIHLIFEEDRAVSRGVNQQSANIGFRYAGRLKRHCRIDADGDIEVEGPYEDLNVWYLPR